MRACEFSYLEECSPISSLQLDRMSPNSCRACLAKVQCGMYGECVLSCRNWTEQNDTSAAMPVMPGKEEASSSEEAAKVEVAMMQLREQIRKLLDRGYSLSFTGTVSHIHQATMTRQATFVMIVHRRLAWWVSNKTSHGQERSTAATH